MGLRSRQRYDNDILAASKSRDSSVECHQAGTVATSYCQQMRIGDMPVAGNPLGAEICADYKRYVI